jgi:Zn ribbon nucleic-acid-binding protein
MPLKTVSIDTSFAAHCPQCNRRDWEFTTNPDSRKCQHCGYVHWLRGEKKSETITPDQMPDVQVVLAHAKTDSVFRDEQFRTLEYQRNIRQIFCTIFGKLCSFYTMAEIVKTSQEIEAIIRELKAP